MQKPKKRDAKISLINRESKFQHNLRALEESKTFVNRIELFDKKRNEKFVDTIERTNQFFSTFTSPKKHVLIAIRNTNTFFQTNYQEIINLFLAQKGDLQALVKLCRITFKRLIVDYKELFTNSNAAKLIREEAYKKNIDIMKKKHQSELKRNELKLRKIKQDHSEALKRMKKKYDERIKQLTQNEMKKIQREKEEWVEDESKMWMLKRDLWKKNEREKIRSELAQKDVVKKVNMENKISSQKKEIESLSEQLLSFKAKLKESENHEKEIELLKKEVTSLREQIKSKQFYVRNDKKDEKEHVNNEKWKKIVKIYEEDISNLKGEVLIANKWEEIALNARKDAIAWKNKYEQLQSIIGISGGDKK